MESLDKVPYDSDVPGFVFWELFYKCNLRCIHCFTNSYPSVNEPDESTIYAIAKLIVEARIFDVGIGGGEPFVWPDLLQLTKYLSENGVAFSISTNGTLLTEDVLRGLSDQGTALLQISIDGDEQTHDKIRGTGVYKKAIRSLVLAKQYDIPVRIAMTLGGMNLDKIDHVVNLAQHYSDRMVVFRLLDEGRADSELTINRYDMERVTRKLSGLKERFNGVIAFNYEPLLFFPYLFADSLYPRFPCSAGKTFFNILPDGDVTPCPHWRNLIVGNILRSGVWPIYEVSKKLTWELQQQDPVGNCRHWKRCHGGCPGTHPKGECDPLCWYQEPSKTKN